MLTMKHTRRGRTLAAALLALALCVGLLPTAALAAEEGVTYIEYSWNEDTQELSSKTESTSEYTVISESDAPTTWGETGQTKWYVVQDNVTISTRVTVTGDVHLILADNCTLTVNGGIQVADNDNVPQTPSPNSLTIYGQTAGTGTLVAKANTTGCAGIGGGSGGDGGTITIYGGTVSATSSNTGAGIGGGSRGDGSTITIYGGTVSATSINTGAGIGGGSTGGSGSFSTGENGTVGNAVIFASSKNGSSISDQSGKESWSGVIFEGNEGKVYGNSITPVEDFSIPKDKKLTIEKGKTLTIQEGVTLTNEGTINNYGTITNNGSILLQGGTFTNNGTVTGNQPCYPTTVEVSASPTPTWGGTVTLTATVKMPSGAGVTLPSTLGTVSFSVGNTTLNNGTGVNVEANSDGTYTAKLENVNVTAENGFAVGDNTITATYSGVTSTSGYGLAESTGTATLTVSKAAQTAPNAPTVSTETPPTANSITLNAVTGGSGQGGVEYGYTTGGGSASEITNWQDETTFNGLTAATAYTFYARYAGNENYESSDPSAGTPIYTAHAAPVAGEEYSIDYEAETITVNSGYEVNTAANFNGTAIQSGASLSDYTGQTLYIRHTGTQGGAPASAAVVLTIPARPAAPTGITGGNNQISGLTDEMEYSTDGESWTEVNAADLSNGVLSNLEAGEYQVRFAATDSAFVSESAAVTVNDLYIPPNPSYLVSVNQAQGGKITANPAAAKKGDTVTLTVTPEDGYELAELTVTDFWGKDVALTANGDGTYTFTMPGSQVEIEAAFTQAEKPDLPFTDVTEADWFYDEVYYVWANGLMIGDSDTTFGPNGTTTRAQVVTILYRLEGEPDLSGENLGYPYEDVPADTWYTDAVYWARLNGIVYGNSDTQFDPDDPITREQLAAMLYRYAEYKGYDVTASGDLSGFADADTVSDWAQEAMRWSVGAGLIQGDENGLTPTATAIRAQIAAILMRFCENVAG